LLLDCNFLSYLEILVCLIFRIKLYHKECCVGMLGFAERKEAVRQAQGEEAQLTR
jgi:hypothetical protein